MLPCSPTDQGRTDGRAHSNRWWVVSVYFAVSLAGSWWFGHYLDKVGGAGGVPNAIFLAFGPIVALAQGHGLLIYLVTTAIVLPLLVASVGKNIVLRLLYVGAALFAWMAVGYWMHAG